MLSEYAALIVVNIFIIYIQVLIYQKSLETISDNCSVLYFRSSNNVKEKLVSRLQ